MLNPVTDELSDFLRRTLPPVCFREVEPRYLQEPRGRWQGRAGLVLAPATTAEVAAIVRAANAARVGVVPYGGGTGLVAGQVAPDIPAPIVLSLERMAAIRAVHPVENVAIVEAGAILADIHATAEQAGRIFPLAYASEGSARIGGALSVNSGGLNVLRYGTARDLCLGLEAVLADGSVWNGLKRLRKDNTGYDLRNLLIGAEGTLGIITVAVLRLFPAPADHATALLTVAGPEAALDLLARAGAMLGGTVSAFELISGRGLSFLDEAGLGLRQPPSPIPDWLVLIETATAAGTDAQAAMTAFFAAAAEAGEVSDGVIAQSRAQRSELWALREAIPAANRRIGAVASHDVSLPIGDIPRFIEAGTGAVARIDPALRVNAFGHLGDGNLHFNVFPPSGQSRDEFAGSAAAVTRALHDLVDAHGGSFSAEHGIGRMKVAELERYGDPVKLAAMRAIKTALDPNGIMNPGAVLREAVQAPSNSQSV